MKKKYDIICNKILSDAVKNGQKIGDHILAERKLAEKFGVSRSTVQHAIKLLIDRKMLKSVQGSGTFWTVEPQEQTSKTVYIPLVLPDRQIESGCYQFIMGAEKFANTHNVYLTIHIINPDSDDEVHTIQRLVDTGFQCIILYSSVWRLNPQFYRDYMQKGIHFIFLDHLPFGITGDMVCSDNVEGGHMATEYLIQKGHKNILFFSQSSYPVSSTYDRYKGYISALQKHNITFNPDFMINENVICRVSEILKLPDPPTACFASNNVRAFHLYTYLQQLPHAPKDFEIVGYDSYETSEKLPFITAIEQPYYEIGYAAAELAYQRIFEKSDSTICRTLPVTLNPRMPAVKP